MVWGDEDISLAQMINEVDEGTQIGLEILEEYRKSELS